MANKLIIMTVVRRIIQLKLDGYSKLKISALIPIHRATLDIYLSKIEKTGFSYNTLLQYSDAQLSLLVNNVAIAVPINNKQETLYREFELIKTELARPGVTRQLLWEEYKTKHPVAYGYSRFCDLLATYMQRNAAAMHLQHRAGDYLQVDFAGKQLHYVDIKTGEIILCPVLVCVLPFSGYAYVEALVSSKQEFLFLALNQCLEYFGGVPRNVLSDNMKQYVGKNNRYEYTFQELAIQWAAHYNIHLDATRPRHPKDKPSVENAVYHSYLRIFAKLRNEEFHSIKALNVRIRELLTDHNQRPFQKLPSSRMDRFLNNEKPLLRPLPLNPFTIKHTTISKVHKNYHVVLGEDKHQYSVPYQHIGKNTKIIYDVDTVEIYIGLGRIALHKRDMRHHAYTTHADHMPEKHLRYHETLGWDAEYFLSIAAKIGEHSTSVFQKIQTSKDFIEQTYKACIGLKRLSERYGTNRFEAACKRALTGSRVNYGIIKNILENNLDQQNTSPMNLFSIPNHDNIRGSEQYQ